MNRMSAAASKAADGARNHVTTTNCVGNVFGNYLAGALRNPSAAAGQQTNLLLGFALCEATGLFGLVVAFILMFGF